MTDATVSGRPAVQSSASRFRAAEHRALDLLVASLLAVVTAPLWIVAGLLWLCRVATWSRTVRLGMGGELFHEWSWTRGRRKSNLCPVIGRLPALLHVLSGRMAIVGPRAVSPGDPLLSLPDSVWRFGVKPGLVCLWWIRQRANIDYGSEVEADYEYAATRSPRRDLGIMLRAAVAWLLGRPGRPVTDELQILGLRIDNLTMSDAVDRIMRLAGGDEPEQVCFLNADCANIAYCNEGYRRTLRGARFTLADGVGLKLAGKLLNREIRQNVNGTDLFPRLCEALSGTPQGLFLLGARPGVAEAVGRWIAENYPDVRLAGCQHGYFTPAEEPAVIERIRASQAAVLLVAFGAPRQEMWIEQHLAETGARVALGVGGLFDFYSGRIPRAPLWMRELCLEWLFRVCCEPRRLWRRYLLGNGRFLFRVLKEKFFGPPGWATKPMRLDLPTGQRTHLHDSGTNDSSPAAPQQPGCLGEGCLQDEIAIVPRRRSIE